MLINDEKLHAVETAEQELLPSVMIRHVRYRRADGSEFAASAVIAEASAVRLISGTAGGGSTNLSVCDKYGQITTINRPCENRKVFDTILLALRQG